MQNLHGLSKGRTLRFAGGQVPVVMSVSGLGPVKGTLELGQPFPAGDVLEVNSPLDITVNGKSAEIAGSSALRTAGLIVPPMKMLL